MGPSLNETQRRILVALCRPYEGGKQFGPPATNQQIAGDVFLSVDSVKGHLRVLYEQFGLSDLPQNRKRAALAEIALERGLLDGERETPAPQRRLVVPLTIGAAVAVVALVTVLAVTLGNGDDDASASTDTVRRFADRYAAEDVDGVMRTLSSDAGFVFTSSLTGTIRRRGAAELRDEFTRQFESTDGYRLDILESTESRVSGRYSQEALGQRVSGTVVFRLSGSADRLLIDEIRSRVAP